MTSQAASYHGYRFPPEIISHAVWLYHRFCLSFRDTEDLLAQRGITVSYEAIRQWCQRFGPEYARILRRRQGRLGDTWEPTSKDSSRMIFVNLTVPSRKLRAESFGHAYCALALLAS